MRYAPAVPAPRRAALLAALAAALVYSPALLRGSLPRSGEPDLWTFFVEKESAVERYRRLETPLWNPRVGLGVPLCSGQETPFYPPNLLLAAPAPIETAWTWLFVLHLAFAGAGAAVFASTAGAPAWAAALGGAAYASAPRFLLGHTNGVPTLVMIAVYLPWFLAAVRLSEEAPIRGAAAAATVLGYAYLASPPSHIHVPLYAGALYALGRAPWAGRRALRAAALLPAVALAAVALSAIQSLPVAAAGAASTRAGGGYEWAVAWAAAPRDLAVLTVAPGAVRGAIRSMLIVFVGATPLALAALAAVRAPRAEAAPLALLLLFSLAAGVGDALPAYRLLVYPVFPMLRAPARLLDIALFALCALAALGASTLAVGAVSPRLRRSFAAAAAGVALLLAAAAWRTRGEGRNLGTDAARWAAAAAAVGAAAPAAAPAALATGLAFDVATYVIPLLTAPDAPPAAPPEVVDRVLAPVPPGARVLSLAGWRSAIQPGEIARRNRRTMISFLALAPKTYCDGFARRVGRPIADASADLVYGMAPFGRIDEEAFGRWGVGWFIRDGADGPEAVPNGAALPRAYLARGETAVAAAVLLRDAPEEVVVAASAPSAGWRLVLADQFDDGWVAEVDGRPAPIMRVEDALRAVEVPPGFRIVRFRYPGRHVRIGAAVSAAAAAALLWALLRLARRREAVDRRPQPE